MSCSRCSDDDPECRRCSGAAIPAVRERARTADVRDPAEFRIVSMEPMPSLGPHTYRITTESERYGRVTQHVVRFQESIIGQQEVAVFLDPLPPDWTPSQSFAALAAGLAVVVLVGLSAGAFLLLGLCWEGR